MLNVEAPFIPEGNVDFCHMAVFISYSHEDIDLASRLHTTLSCAQIPVQWDRSGLSEGQPLFERIQSMLLETDCVVALLTPSSINRRWVQVELAQARRLGIKALPVVLGLDADEISSALRGLITSLPDELADIFNLAYLRLSDDSDYELGRVAKRIYALLPSFYRETLWREAPREFLRLSPVGGEHLFSQARISLFIGSLETAYREYSFGRSGVVLPTSTDGNLRGLIAGNFLREIGVKNKFETQPVKPDRPVYLGMHEERYFIAATTFGPANKPSSKDQETAARSILKLATELKLSVVIVPQLGTGPVYSYPRFQAYKSFLAGILKWYTAQRVDADIPWIVLVVPDTDAGLMLSYNSSMHTRRLEQICSDRLSLAFHGQAAVCTSRDTLRNALSQCGHTAESAAKRVGVALGRTVNPLFRWPHTPQKEVFAYSPDTRICDTICSDGDSLLLLDS